MRFISAIGLQRAEKQQCFYLEDVQKAFVVPSKVKTLLYLCGHELPCTIQSEPRQLKTDLNLRPIYHIKDECSDAHLFLGLLSYWIVNTIRYKLKQTGEKCYWTEIVRRLSTQKAITTEAVNALGEKVQLRQCSEPTKAAADIYQRLKYKAMPFRRRKKLCSTQ